MLIVDTQKKYLLDKFTPVSIVNAILGKHKESGINQKTAEKKNPNDMNQMIFIHYVHMPIHNINAIAEDKSKKLAQ